MRGAHVGEREFLILQRGLQAAAVDDAVLVGAEVDQLLLQLRCAAASEEAEIGAEQLAESRIVGELQDADLGKVALLHGPRQLFPDVGENLAERLRLQLEHRGDSQGPGTHDPHGGLRAGEECVGRLCDVPVNVGVQLVDRDLCVAVAVGMALQTLIQPVAED